MKCILIMAIVLACLPTAKAYAQDKSKTDFTHTLEFRLRDTFEQNESGNSGVKPAHHNAVDQRVKLGLGYKANEKFSATASLLQSASWGQIQNETAIGDRGSVVGQGSGTGPDEPNFLSVNEAFATWLVSDDFILKFGRMNFSFGDNSVMSVNDYQKQPYAFDGVTGRYEFDFGRITGFGFKYRDLSNLTTTTTASSDAQHDAYGLVFDLKTMPDWMKLVSVNVIQDVADGVYGATSGNTVQTLQNTNALRFGAAASAAVSMFDFKVNYQAVNGKNSDAAAGSGAVANERSINSRMYQAEVGVNFSEFMASRVYVNYHVDSGTKQADMQSSTKTYDPYFYERHTAAGLMELVGWGNLTDISAGWTMKPSETTDVGLGVHILSKTEKEDYTNGGIYGQNLFASNNQRLCGLDANSPACSSSIGTEYDLWVEHRYSGGLSTLARVGYFTPGDVLKDAVVNKSANVWQLMVQGKLNF